MSAVARRDSSDAGIRALSLGASLVITIPATRLKRPGGNWE